jgi:hypothetical protein
MKKEILVIIDCILLGCMGLSVWLKFQFWQNAVVLCFAVGAWFGVFQSIKNFKGWKSQGNRIEKYFWGIFCVNIAVIALVLTLCIFIAHR